MTNDEAQMTKMGSWNLPIFIRHSDFFRHSDFVIRHSPFIRHSASTLRKKRQLGLFDIAINR